MPYEIRRSTQAAVDCLHALAGIALALSFDRVGTHWFSRERWYDSPLLPVWVGLLLFTAASLLTPAPLWRRAPCWG